jgi:hypothetical protein
MPVPAPTPSGSWLTMSTTPGSMAAVTPLSPPLSLGDAWPVPRRGAEVLGLVEGALERPRGAAFGDLEPPAGGFVGAGAATLGDGAAER